MVQFASRSRVNGGLRLLYRSACHAAYVHEPDIRDATIKMCIFKGETFIGISKRVAASFYDKADKRLYMKTTYITSKYLIGCECDCAIGSKVGNKCSVTGTVGINKEADSQQTCVHNMVVIYCLILELHKGLAKHILIELIARVNNFIQVDNNNFRKDIAIQQTAAGAVCEISPIKDMIK